MTTSGPIQAVSNFLASGLLRYSRSPKLFWRNLILCPFCVPFLHLCCSLKWHTSMSVSLFRRTSELLYVPCLILFKCFVYDVPYDRWRNVFLSSHRWLEHDWVNFLYLYSFLKQCSEKLNIRSNYYAEVWGQKSQRNLTWNVVLFAPIYWGCRILISTTRESGRLTRSRIMSKLAGAKFCRDPPRSKPTTLFFLFRCWRQWTFHNYGPIYQHKLTLIPAWISNHMPS